MDELWVAEINILLGTLTLNEILFLGLKLMENYREILRFIELFHSCTLSKTFAIQLEISRNSYLAELAI